MTDGYAGIWHLLRRAFEAAEERGADPVVVSTLPFRTDEHHDHSGLPLVLVPPGRLIAMAVGLRAALPDTMLLLVGAADSVTLGTNHLIHAARRNMGMILLVLRDDLLPSGDDALDRSGWVEIATGDDAPRGTPLDWASALHAGLVARADINDTGAMTDLLLQAHERGGFSVIGLTGDTSLPLGVQSTNDWPEFFSAYRQWAAPLLRENPELQGAPNVEPDASAPDRVEVRIAGIGGQGVKLAGTILSEAAGLGAGLWATHYGQYGSATRGGPSKVDVVYGSERITYAGADHPDVLVALSDGALESNAAAVGPDSRLVVDADVDGEIPEGALVVPLLQLAREHTGKPIAAGVTSLGSVAALAAGITADGLIAVIREKLPGRVAEKNSAAFAAAYELTQEQIGASV
jgi:2-oxoglutarate ferredoxin oxidoreductase subunit gamma